MLKYVNFHVKFYALAHAVLYMHFVQHQNRSFFGELHLLLPNLRREVTSFGVMLSIGLEFPVDKDRYGGLIVIDQKRGFVLLHPEDLRRDYKLFIAILLHFFSLLQRYAKNAGTYCGDIERN